MKSRLTVILSFVVSLFLTLTLLATALCAFGSAFLEKSEGLEEAALKSDYSNTLYEEIKYDFENLLSITGVMETESIMTVLTPEMVERDALSYLAYSYGDGANLDTLSLEADLYTKIRTYIESVLPEGEEWSEELENNLNDLVSACVRRYCQGIQIPMLPKIGKTLVKLGSYLKWGAIAAALASLGCMAYLFLLHKPRRKALYYHALSTTTNSVLFLGAVYLAKQNHITERLPIKESALQDLLSTYLQSLLGVLEQIGWVFLGATVLLLLAESVLYFISQKKEKNEPLSELTSPETL